MRKSLKRTGLVVAVSLAVVAVAQGVRPESATLPTDSSHAIEAQPGTSSALSAVLNRSCGECHSNSMTSRWYTRVPPFSAIIARGARDGRKAVNFSEWTGYSTEQQRALLAASCSDVRLGKMPVKAYVGVRPNARLSTQDVETICAATSETGAAPATSAAQQQQSRREP